MQTHKFAHWEEHYTEKRPAPERAAGSDGGGLLGVQQTGGEENVTLHSETEAPGRLEDLREGVCSAPDTEAGKESEGAAQLSALDFQFRDLRYVG